ncbi:hypothetical protein SKAU_G00402980 [Synaphobranchus kaupii]|uniref:Uncharacterized protein n=1 Tax=Synaphobranchus kaupii TaxID=118154 RepID=A0A9Q1E9G3_SYNKA|nr:hypothetical protein SKAU_G00402980 [Synaphobranchus kaupii]
MSTELHLFPQLFPPQQMTLQPGLSPLQIPTAPPVNQMNVVQEGISPFILFLPPGQPAPPFLLPANIVNPSRLPGGGSPLWPSAPLCRNNFQDNVYVRSPRWTQPSRHTFELPG